MISSWNMTIFEQVSLMCFKMIDHTVNFDLSVIQMYCGQKRSQCMVWFASLLNILPFFFFFQLN